MSESSVTLRRAWQDYQKTRTLKPVTVRGYQQLLDLCLSDWLDIPMNEISKEMIEERHASINAKRMANNAFRFLASIYAFARAKYTTDRGGSLVPFNPVYRLTELRQWHKQKRRETSVHPHQLHGWFQSVESCGNYNLRDFLILLLLTGMRRSEARLLTWERVDLNGGIIRLEQTKNGRTHIVPLSDYALRMLQERRAATHSKWVFPSNRADKPFSAASCLIEKIIQRSGIRFTPHDLRRTFVMIADDIELNPQIVKALINHERYDVTEGYAIRSPERLRRATQQITDRILQYGRHTATAVQALESLSGPESPTIVLEISLLAIDAIAAIKLNGTDLKVSEITAQSHQSGYVAPETQTPRRRTNDTNRNSRR